MSATTASIGVENQTKVQKSLTWDLKIQTVTKKHHKTAKEQLTSTRGCTQDSQNPDPEQTMRKNKQGSKRQ